MKTEWLVLNSGEMNKDCEDITVFADGTGNTENTTGILKQTRQGNRNTEMRMTGELKDWITEMQNTSKFNRRESVTLCAQASPFDERDHVKYD